MKKAEAVQAAGGALVIVGSLNSYIVRMARTPPPRRYTPTPAPSPFTTLTSLIHPRIPVPWLVTAASRPMAHVTGSGASVEGIGYCHSRDYGF